MFRVPFVQCFFSTAPLYFYLTEAPSSSSLDRITSSQSSIFFNQRRSCSRAHLGFLYGLRFRSVTLYSLKRFKVDFSGLLYGLPFTCCC